MLQHPLTRGLDIDAPETTQLRQRIIQEKPFLRRVYEEWYRWLAGVLPGSPPGAWLELGSGGGFMRQCLPGLITSEIFPLPEIDLIASGLALPFQAASLSAILMTNVFHHLPKPRSFLAEAARCLKPGGAIAMIEPWVTPWSGWVYSHLHEEPFDPHSGTWEFPEKGPLSGANNALAWIIFQRDREQFRREYPQMHIQQITPMMPFCYLLSGGVSLRSLMPGWSFAAWRGLENRLSPWMGKLAMFAGIVLRA